MFGVSFAGIGATETLTLGEVVKGDFSFGDAIMIPDETGVYSQYTFITAEVAEEEEIEGGEGWYGDDGENHNNDVTFRNGQSFWIFPDSAVTVTIAGQVKSSWEYEAPANVYSMIANPFPTQITLGKFTYPGAFGDAIMIPDEDGVYTQYTYITAEVAEEEEIEGGSGWYGDDGENHNADPLPANQGFWLLPGADVTISATLSL